MSFLEKIEMLIAQNDLNKRKLSLESGIPYNTVRNFWVQGVENMQLPTFRKLCDYFNVTMDSMAYDDREIEYRSDRSPDSLTKEEQKLVKTFACLDERGQQTVWDVVNGQLKNTHEEKKEPIVA